MAWPRRRTAQSPEQKTVAQMRRALHHVLSGDLADAESALAAAVRADSASAEAYLPLANLYRARGEIGRAIQIHQNLLLRTDLDEALRHEALLGLALDFREGGFLRRAAAAFEELLEVEPRNLQALRELERLHVESGDWEGAIRVRRSIGRADPATPRVLAHLWTGLGRERAKAGRATEARQAFRRALGQDRRCAEAYLALGDEKLREGRTRKAIGLWRRALPLHPAIGNLIYPRLWEGYSVLDERTSFEALLHAQLEREPDDREASIWLARTVVHLGRVDEGLATLRRVLDRAPGSLPLYAEIGRILLREKRDFEALKCFEELLDRLPLERQRLHCRACGAPDTELRWRCAQCGAWDSFGPASTD
ncbi:MAG: tetratricopeptide repeat protein [Myxococcota bacterium]